METLESRRVLDAVAVSTPADVVDGNLSSIAALIASPGADGEISLREAVAAAASSGDTVNFDPSLNNETITLNRALGEIAFNKSLTIDGGSLDITIDANDPSEAFGDGIRIFNIIDPDHFDNDAPHVTMIGLTLTGGDPAQALRDGGAIRSEATLTLRDMIIRDNNAELRGGGVFLAVAPGGAVEREVLRIEQGSVIERNDANFQGGGVFILFDSDDGGKDTVLIDHSSLSNQNTAGQGGALAMTGNNPFTHGHVVVSYSNIDQNRALGGGAIYVQSTGRIDLDIVESQIIGNTTAFDEFGLQGGGIYADLVYESRLRIQRSEISGNSAGLSGGGMWVWLREGATLTIEDSKISGNTSSQDGGGAYVRSDVDLTPSDPTALLQTVTISRSIISGNTAFNRGGGLFSSTYYGTAMLVEDTRITDNTVPYGVEHFDRSGGGIFAYIGPIGGTVNFPKPMFTISRSTVDNNRADLSGGGICVFGPDGGHFVATNTTVSGNRTLDATDGMGGGIMVARYDNPGVTVDVYLRNVTVTQNASKNGGGLATLDDPNIRVRVGNSIISENFDVPDPLTRQPNNIDGRIVAAEFKHNLYGTGPHLLDHVTGLPATIDSTNWFENSPGLDELQDRGGLTPTHSLLVGSDAIDAGDNSLLSHPLTGDPLTTDQRGSGFTRSFNIASVAVTGAGPVDIGAYEVGLAKIIDVIISGSKSVHDPYRFSDALRQGIHQLRTVPVGGADTIEVVFSEHVNIFPTDLALLGGYTGTDYTSTWTVVDWLYDPLTFTARWRFDSPDDPDSLPNWFPADMLEIGLNVDGPRAILDAYGNSLDGEWLPIYSLQNPLDSFPSGDGTAGGPFYFVFTILPGDIRLENIVAGVGILEWQRMLNPGPNSEFTDGDFDGDGDVDQNDRILWMDNFGKDLSTW